MVVAAFALGLGVPSGIAAAKVFHDQKEALELAFPGADRIEEKTVVLSAGESERIAKLAGADLATEIVRFYSGWRGDELQGYAYIDVHTVRTLPEAFMVVLEPDGRVRSLRVLAFYEPLDYKPTDRWYHQFDGAEIGSTLRVGRDIHGILGATLSARAVADSVRRVQAFYQVLISDPRIAASGRGGAAGADGPPTTE